jgi:uncharacterized protein (TIGR02118 family)
MSGMIQQKDRGRAVLKLTFCLRRLPSLSLEEFQDYWLNKHGPLVRSLQPALGMVRYVQVHRLDSDLADGMQHVRGAPEPYDGVAELWWPDLASAERAAASPEFRVEQLNDTQQFVDVERLQGFVAEENRVIWP